MDGYSENLNATTLVRVLRGGGAAICLQLRSEMRVPRIEGEGEGQQNKTSFEQPPESGRRTNKVRSSQGGSRGLNSNHNNKVSGVIPGYRNVTVSPALTRRPSHSITTASNRSHTN